MIARTLLAVLLAAGGAAAADWVDLFDGKTLNGWSVHSGTATFTVENGEIVGTAVLGSPNTFLCTNKEYGDFILEFEVKTDPELNSGVQIRSQIAREPITITVEVDGRQVERKIPAGRVYGYQVEIATAASGTSGNVYDEARRARFLDDFTNRPAARAAFKDGEWNKYRVECRGDSIKTWVNGVPAADFRDSMTLRGIIGLQVHQIPKDRFKPYKVRWRNIRIREL
ncbi:MAG TPA: DUF1080 domain-containing protein [Bryobacteraceae bacterium]|nr:DUF1080 domain-containing protein [Bryobacteraceae bacterium]HOQ43980.1 DUF1080 domain-containing protein [Bryobacteraceae bacterium]HPQ15570.1 DUF1080 domain-containing protein [Bryobacteraceae bacterium]HPU72958.1 DUF1080 domain-containing protein [Bryobacteraceae bacterium]